MTKLIHADETHALLGACFEVYKEKVADSWRRFFRNALSWNSRIEASHFKPRSHCSCGIKGGRCGRHISRIFSASTKSSWRSRR
jgi:hypothetical protein